VESRALDPTGADLPARWRADSTHLAQYLRAHTELDDIDVPGARASFQRLVEEAPFYAPGWSGLSVALYRSGGNDIPPKQAMPRALEAAKRALALDSTLAEPLETLIAYDMWGRWDMEGAKRRIDAAIARFPAHAEFYNLLGTWHRFHGDFDASFDVKVENNARDPLSTRYAYQIAASLYWAHRCSEGVTAYRRLPAELRAARDNLMLYRLFRCQGKEAEAAEAMRAAMIQQGDSALARRLEGPLTPAQRKRAVQAGFRKELERQLARRKSGWSAPEKIMLQYAEMQNADSTLAWLDSMYVDRSMMIMVVPTDPLNDFLRDDPRFQAYLERLTWSRVDADSARERVRP
jgi:adenylate cyclase